MERKTDLKLNGKIIGQFIATQNKNENKKRIINLLKEKNLYNNSSEIEKILRQAFSFEKATKILFEEQNGINIPFIVNGAFCIELLIKSLHISLKSKEKGHDLLDLYNKLPNNIKNSISKNFSLENNTYDLFEIELKNLKDAFIEWRYMHEKEETSMVVSGVVFTIILVLKKELENYNI